MDYFTDEGEHSDHSEFDELERYIIDNPSTDEDGFPTFLPTAFLTKLSEQSWSEVYKKCISDH